MQRALNVTRERFADWYQAVVRDADMAETSPVRGAMVIKPWGYGVWELIQQELDRRIKATGHENCYFPLFIPLSFIAKEAEHVEGFAKEMAVVTHHRLKTDRRQAAARSRSQAGRAAGGAPHLRDHHRRRLLALDQEPPRPAAADQPMGQCGALGNAPAPVPAHHRIPLAGRPHRPCHARPKRSKRPRRMLEVYRAFAEDMLAMPVIAGEKPENERFPGAVNTYSIEAMMQDGKALQAGTSHFLGTHFAEAQNIKFQNEAGALTFCNTTSWGVSTRLIGGVIMTHGDDDGLRLPPAIAPRQIVVVPMLRDKPEDAEVLAYCENLVKALCGDDRVRPAAARPSGHQEDQVGGKALELGAARRAHDRRGRAARCRRRPGHLYAPRRSARRRQGQIHRQAAGGFRRRRGAAAGRNPGRALCRSQGAAGRQHQDRRHQLRRAWRNYFGEDDDELQRLGARGLVEAAPARRWKRSSKS